MTNRAQININAVKLSNLKDHFFTLVDQKMEMDKAGLFANTSSARRRVLIGELEAEISKLRDLIRACQVYQEKVMSGEPCELSQQSFDRAYEMGLTYQS
jgi:hypothetical protein